MSEPKKKRTGAPLNEWIAITYTMNYSNPEVGKQREGPVLCKKARHPQHGMILRWPTGSWMMWPKQARVLKRYGRVDLDDAELQFYRDFMITNIETGVRFSAGWLAPTGTFYPCHYSEHDGLATRLTVLVYDTLGGTRDLEDKGWLRMHKDGVIGRVGGIKRLPKAQREALFDLASLEDADDVWRMHIRDVIRWATEE